MWDVAGCGIWVRNADCQKQRHSVHYIQIELLAAACNIINEEMTLKGRERALPRVRISAHGKRAEVDALLASLKLNTVCRDAACPNQWECFNRGTATFMLMGRYCTRNCRFCNIENTVPEKVDCDEAVRVAEAVDTLQIRYVVITSVTRDDILDGGASHFAATLEAIHRRTPAVKVEVLVPDFCGDYAAIEAVVNGRPTVFNHNVETVARISKVIRPEASYLRSLAVLAYVARIAPDIPVKSGLMLGFGETEDEIKKTIQDIYSTGCSILTIGQYLSPSSVHEPVRKQYSEKEFEKYKKYAMRIGFAAVASGSLVRSSYTADAIAQTAFTHRR